jgi:hypothetical protein
VKKLLENSITTAVVRTCLLEIISVLIMTYGRLPILGAIMMFASPFIAALPALERK